MTFSRHVVMGRMTTAKNDHFWDAPDDHENFWASSNQKSKLHQKRRYFWKKKHFWFSLINFWVPFFNFSVQLRLSFNSHFPIPNPLSKKDPFPKKKKLNISKRHTLASSADTDSFTLSNCLSFPPFFFRWNEFLRLSWTLACQQKKKKNTWNKPMSTAAYDFGFFAWP